MEISASSTQSGFGASTSRPEDAASASISSDFDTFLRMLTTQITNQDPLNPMNAEEFAVQLATFSGVEQQVRTNDLLQGLGQRMGQTGLGDMAGWIGLDVRAAMPVEVDGAPVEVTLPTPLAGSTHELIAVDRYGSEVGRFSVSPANGTFTWDGQDPNGVPVPPGLYSFTLESFEGDSFVASAPAEIYAPVREIRSDAQGIVLVFDGGVERLSTDIGALRQHGFDAA
ncbi:flagellar hook capping FlgD N-terminal domain-containing protein [Oceaniglobus indicus]|uniref:flagellar hook capping FlgD N-terminal domain-containing protein n=1 Tax=Oceaniglobus indicus TaxID=2047749 RepID=UPI0013043FB6|nr:flagellar hook capping FlgD N-terminal domain-containing protein [Oceaniglobus indicus]